MIWTDIYMIYKIIGWFLQIWASEKNNNIVLTCLLAHKMFQFCEPFVPVLSASVSFVRFFLLDSLTILTTLPCLCDPTRLPDWRL